MVLQISRQYYSNDLLQDLVPKSVYISFEVKQLPLVAAEGNTVCGSGEL